MADAMDTTSEHADTPAPSVTAHGGGHTARHPSPKEYIRIALILGAITAAEVGIYYMNISRGLLIPALFFFAIVKFALVVLWFMHLRFDSRMYSRFFLMGLAGTVTLFMIVLITFKVFSG
jgi:cytochrome c oxidase subunit 4